MWEETLVLLVVICTVCSLTGNPEIVTSLKSCQKHPPPPQKNTWFCQGNVILLQKYCSPVLQDKGKDIAQK